jgi:TolB-like protein
MAFLSQNSENVSGQVQRTEKIKSIAVLPFVNMSNDSEQEYFAMGWRKKSLIRLLT